MTRFTRCESSPSPVIVVRSAPPCHRTAPEKAPRKDLSEPLHWTSTRRVREGLRERLPRGLLKAQTSNPHPPLHLPPSTHHRNHFWSRSTRTVSLVETLVVEPWSTNALAAAQRGVAATTPCLGKAREAHRRCGTGRDAPPQRAKCGGAARLPKGTEWPVQVRERSTRTR